MRIFNQPSHATAERFKMLEACVYQSLYFCNLSERKLVFFIRRARCKIVFYHMGILSSVLRLKSRDELGPVGGIFHNIPFSFDIRAQTICILPALFCASKFAV